MKLKQSMLMMQKQNYKSSTNEGSKSGLPLLKFSGSSVGSVQSVRSSHGSSEYLNNNLIFKASKY